MVYGLRAEEKSRRNIPEPTGDKNTPENIWVSGPIHH